MDKVKNIDEMPKKSPLSLQIDLKKFEKATEEEKKQQDVMSESVSFFRDGMRKLMRNPLAVGSIIVLLLIVAMILIVPHVVPYSYSQIISVNGKRDKTASNMAPFQYSDKEQAYIAEGGKVFPHIMGTDEMGRDYFVTCCLWYQGFTDGRCVCRDYCSDNRRAVRKYFRLFRRQDRPYYDAYCRYYIFPSGYADGSIAFSRTP